MAKEPVELKWVEDLLPPEGYRRKSMFGGFAYYIEDKIVMLIFENPGDFKHRNQLYEFEVWNGCMFPVEREYQLQALKQFPDLKVHPVLPKWLYLPLHTEAFDELVSDILHQVLKPSGYWGSIPKVKGPKKSASRKLELETISVNMDTRRPRMFSDEPAEIKLKTAVKISDLKNLGPASEKSFHRAGIKTAPQFIKLGWKKALLKLIEVDSKHRHSLFAYALIGALANKEWTGLSSTEKEEARNYVKSLASQNKLAKQPSKKITPKKVKTFRKKMAPKSVKKKRSAKRK